MALTALQVKNAKPGRHADGKGLYLLVKPSGAKSWVLRVMAVDSKDGEWKRRDFGLGSVDLVSLSEARDKAIDGRKLARAGKDPAVEWKREADVIPTFEEAARQHYDNIKASFKNARHRETWLSSLKTYVFPIIGSQRVDTVDATAIHKALAPIWLTIPETAQRVRGRIAKVLDFAKAKNWRADEAPMRSVAAMLPRKRRAKAHHPAMPYSDVPAFYQQTEAADETVGRLALLFDILTASRPGEVRGARFREFELDAENWHIPGERMKGGLAHTVALSPPAIAIVERMKQLAGGNPDDLVFPGKGGKPLSDMTLTKVLRDADIPPEVASVHGFRSSFRDWVAEEARFPGEWAEAALAHALPNKVEAAYRRTKFLEQRRELMKAWANYLEGKTNVIALAERRA